MTTQHYLEPTQAAKAPLTAYQAALRARMITAACTLAHQRALQATKFALQARGLKVVTSRTASLACWRLSMGSAMRSNCSTMLPRRLSSGGSKGSSASGRSAASWSPSN